VGQAKNSTNPSTLDYEFIDTPEALASFAQMAGKADTIAVDLEADSMFHYQEKVCLLQMAANDRSAVIDPLAIGDLSVLKGLFQNSAICKVLHGADYDVRSLFRDFGICITNLFDTQLACMYLGYKETGLEAVVANRFGVTLNKKYQKKDWSQRPLPEGMVDYAASDVAYLFPLARALTKELTLKGRLDWVTEECRLLTGVRPPENNDDPLYIKFKGAGRLEPRQLAALEALLQTRNSIARHKDRPLFKIIGNMALKKIAVEMPASTTKLKESHALSPRQLEMYGKYVMTALEEARQLPKEALPCYPRRKSPRLSPRVPERVNHLRAWRDQMAKQLDLDPGLVINRTLIKSIAVENPSDKAALENVEGIHDWQVKTFGSNLLNVLKSYPL
jgi:ribonuclease D